MGAHPRAREPRPTRAQIRKVPALFVSSACMILNSVAEYMLSRRDKPVLPGHTIELGRDTLLLLQEGRADEAAGYDESHYRVPVLTITALEPACACCEPRASA